MEDSLAASSVSKGIGVRGQIGKRSPTTPKVCVRKKLFDLDECEGTEDGELSPLTSSSEYFSQSSNEKSCNTSERFSQTINLFSSSPSTKVRNHIYDLFMWGVLILCLWV